MNKKVKHGTLLTVIFTVLSLLYLICSSDHLMLLHVCMVYLSCEDKVHKSLIYALSVCNDRTIPDGNVYII